MSGSWLEDADRIAHSLLSTAIRHGGRCSWVGRSKREVTTSGILIPAVEALGPELYDGTAGVALFLGRLHAKTGEARVKLVAREAIEHALTEVQRSESLFGLHGGFGGIAFAAAHLALLLDEGDLERRARELLGVIANASTEGVAHDLLSGVGGTIAALRAWPSSLLVPSDLALSVRLGTTLADAATRHDGFWAWTEDGSHPLTGLSHGAAGIGLILMQLHRDSGIDRFFEMGRSAFDYENHHFDLARNNWPDFRPGASTARGRTFGYGWCHGAPGIALARRHVLSLCEDPVWRNDWHVALETSRLASSEFFELGSDTTLCHGLAGCMEPLLEAGEYDHLTRIWQPLLERFRVSGDWPSGLPSRGPNPSLMLGTAGIGYTFLRMHDPKTPSVLLPLLGSER